jgi:hypothetical protein
MKLPENIISTFKPGSINDTSCYLTTSNLAGVVNLMPVHYTDVYLDEYILIPDLFAQKTKINLNENRYGILSVSHTENEQKIIIKGPCNVIQWGHPKSFRFFDALAGPILETWGNWTEKEDLLNNNNQTKPGVFAQRGVIILKAEIINSHEVK